MRYAVFVGLPLLLAAPAAAADRPIPQDRARMEKRFQDRLAWNRRTLGAAYEKVGKKDPRWDEAARKALDLAARMYSLQYEPIVPYTEVHAAAKQAVEAGCRDPLILYVYARTSLAPNFPGAAEYDKRLQAASVAMAASGYSPFRRAVAIRTALDNKLSDPTRLITPTDRPVLAQKLDVVFDLLRRSAAEDQRTADWDERWFDEINAAIRMHTQLSGDYKAAFDRVDAGLARIPGIEALRLVVKGNFYFYWGWEARGQGFAPAVAEEQARTFVERLGEARTALLEAWKRQPGQPNVARLMIDVENAIGGGDREAMETWFERAMLANGDDRGACLTKLDWLDPKWHGGDSPDEMLAFGKACAATKNWHTGIILLAADAHYRVAVMTGGRDGVKYLRTPAVWNEIRTVFDDYLKHYPDDNVVRSKYAVICYQAMYYHEAQAQFQAVGDRLAPWRGFPNMPLGAMKEARDQTARLITGKPSPLDTPGRGNDPDRKKP
jgi:hypothetical protein